MPGVDGVDVAAFGEAEQVLGRDAMVLVIVVSGGVTVSMPVRSWRMTSAVMRMGMARRVPVAMGMRMPVLALHAGTGRVSPRPHLHRFLTERRFPRVDLIYDQDACQA